MGHHPVVSTLILPLLGWSCGIQTPVKAQCPTIIPQIAGGSAQRSKVGFLCDGCPRKYFLVREDGLQSTYWLLSEWTNPIHSSETHYEKSAGVRWQVDPDLKANGLPREDGCGNTDLFIVEANYSYESVTYGPKGQVASGCTIEDGQSDPPGCTITPPEFPYIEMQGVTGCEFSGAAGIVEDSSGSNPHVEISCAHSEGVWLTDEYTTSALEAKVRDLAIGRVPEQFSSDNPVLDETPKACVSINAQEDCAEAKASRWRAKVTNTVPGKKYRILYDIVTFQATGGITNWTVTPVTNIVCTAPSETWWYPSEAGEVIDPPDWLLGYCPTFQKGEHEIAYVNFDITPAESSGSPGSSSFGDGEGGCASCGPSSKGSGPLGLEFSVSMGEAWGGGSAGELRLAVSSPIEGLGTPDLLSFTGETDPNGGVEIVHDANGVIIQVATPQAFAVVEEILSGTSYKIIVYKPAAQGAWNVDRYSVVNPESNLVVTWTIEDLGGTPRQVEISSLRGQLEQTWTYSHDPATGQWTFMMPGQVAERRTFHGTDLISGNRIQLVQLATPGGSVVRQWSRTYARFAWGEGLVAEADGAGDDAQSTVYDYYPGVESAGYAASSASPPVRLVSHPDGTWEQYAQYDALGRPLLVLSGIDTGPTDDPALCRSTLYSYSPLAGTQDDGSLQPNTARTVVQKFKNIEVSRSYRVIEPGCTRDIQCLTAGASHTASDNLITTNYYYTDGDLAGRLRNSDNPDGTRTAYIYRRSGSGPTSTETTVTLTGQVDPAAGLTGFTNILAGEVATTTMGALGEVQSRIVQDKQTLIVLAQETYSYPDPLLPSHSVTYLDGTSTTTLYGCCGLESVTDRDGVVTQYLRDEAGRSIGTISHDIILLNQLDAAGNTLVTQRIGTDQSVITLSQSAYDTAGRVTSQTNALLGETRFAETIDGSGQRVRTTTFPDGGTRIETFFRDGQLASLTGTAVQPVRYEYGIETEGGVQRLGTKEIKLDASFADTSQWTKQYTDMAGRDYKTLYAGPGGHYRQSFYNSRGQLWKTRDPDDVTTLYQYDSRGGLVTTAIDMDRDGIVDRGSSGSTDRVHDSLTTVTTYSGTNVRQTEQWVFTTDSSPSTNLVAVSRISTDGLRSWNTVYRDGPTPVVTATRTVYAGNGNRYITNTAPDGSYVLSAYTYGRLVSVTRRNSSHGQLGKTTYGYDTHGRQATVTDARNGTTTLAHNDADLVTAVTTPAPGTGQPAQTTVTQYNPMLQAIRIVQPDGSSVTNEYHLTGLLARTYGSRSYPVGYGYDAQGRMTSMTNWTAFDPVGAGIGERVTTWNYHASRGWLSNKRYPDGTGPDYGYKPSGRLLSRTWARGNPRVTTTYAYSNAGDLSTVTYANDPAGTQNLTYTYDRRGRRATVAQGSMTTTFHYNEANQLIGEGYSGGTLGGLAVTNLYDAFLRRTYLAAKKNTTTLASGSFGYDTAGRLSTVTDGSWNSTYTYLANSPLVSQIVHKLNSTVAMTDTRQYDLLNRLTSISSTPAGANQLPVSFAYQYNDANQRIRATLQDGSYWIYEYDALGQVISGKRYWMDGSPVPGQQFEYGFDDIGNRSSAKAGGNAAGTGLRSATYSANSLNQVHQPDGAGRLRSGGRCQRQ